MKKIPTLFKRDFDGNPRYVTPEITPGCEWVLIGEGTPTVKYDGTCVQLDVGGQWWARREVKATKQPPPGWVMTETDAETGKSVGWEPIEQSGFARWHAEAVANEPQREWIEGTYELCGPKVNGNPHGYDRHELVRHADAERVGRMTIAPRMLNFEGLRIVALTIYDSDGWEGIVWHHPDGRMAKIKARDFERPANMNGPPWPGRSLRQIYGDHKQT